MVGRMAVVSDTGRRRRRNEDAFVCAPPLFAVADGMGGAQAGEVASGLAAAVLEEGAGDERGEERVASLIQEANRRVFQRSNEDAATSGMGTTMTVALVDSSGGTIAFGHVGDSRAYRVRDGRLEQLTDDHSLVGELVRSGKLSPEEAETHPQRSVITRALGTEPDVDVDTFTVEARPDDLYLLCSDGLTDMISADEIFSVLDGQRRSRGGGTRADRGGERGRWRGQHHGRALPDRRPRRGRADRADARGRRAGTGRGRRGHALGPRSGPRRRHRGDSRGGGRGAACSAWTRSSRSRPEPRRRLLPLIVLVLLIVALDRARRLGALTLSLRNRELLNLIAVGLLTAIGFASVYIARSSLVDAGSLTYAGIFVALYLSAHLVARYTVPWADPVLLPLAALLSAIGVIMIYRLNPDDAFRQSLWVVIGVALFALTLILLRRDFRVLESYKYLFGITSLLLMMLPALPGVGQTINGARLWVKVGSFQFQPGELAKIFLIVFLAGYLRDKREVLAQGRLKDFGPLLLIWGAAMLVLLQTNDLGSALLQFGIFLAMLYVATGRAAYTAAGLGLFLAGSALVYHYVGHVRERVTIWLDPWTD